MRQDLSEGKERKTAWGASTVNSPLWQITAVPAPATCAPSVSPHGEGWVWKVQKELFPHPTALHTVCEDVATPIPKQEPGHSLPQLLAIAKATKRSFFKMMLGQ